MQKELIVLADGCFDPLHSGHIEHLKAASKLGSHLIVNTNPDSIIWKKRPKVGPFLTKNNRKALLETLPFIDKVTSMRTVQVLEKFRPDIYIQGMDWKEKLPKKEIEMCGKLNIKIHYSNIRTNSSTKILDRFLKQYQKINHIEKKDFYDKG